MSSKWMRRGLWLFAAIIGLVLGLWRPVMTQGLLSPIGIIAGIGYFVFSQTSLKQKEDDDSEDTFERWFILIQMLLYFIIGGAIGSMIPLLLTQIRG